MTDTIEEWRFERNRLRTNENSAIKYAVAMDEVNDELRAENERLRTALEAIASHDTGMKADFSVGAKQAQIARAALGKLGRTDD